METLLRELANIDAAAAARCDYHKTIALLRALKTGAVSLDTVTLTENGWTVAAIVPSSETEPASSAIADAAQETP